VDNRFCSQCGGKLTTKVIEDRERHYCPACGFVQYQNPIPAAAVTIIQDAKILLVKRAVEPKKGLWSLPAGFLEMDETIEECAVREVKEETNLDVELDGLLAVYSVFDDPRYICLLVVYSGRIIGGELRCGDDASDAHFFPQSTLPEMAFSVHRRAIDLAFQRAGFPASLGEH
jgi:ADP-ribose pyrophosphatase YjhB (NUDIX family)